MSGVFASPSKKIPVFLFALCVPLVVAAAGEKTCKTQWDASSAKGSCGIALTWQYTKDSCEINVKCRNSYGKEIINVVHRKLDSVSQLTNNEGNLRGGDEATPPTDTSGRPYMIEVEE